MAVKKRLHWVILPVLLFGLFGGVVFTSNPVNATSYDQVEMQDDAWNSFSLDMVTVERSAEFGESVYDSSGKSLVSTSATCALDPTGIISRWPLNEADGATKFFDKEGGHHGTCEGAMCPSATRGIVQGAFKFTPKISEEDEIRVPSSTDFDWLPKDSFSIGVWVKTTQDCSGNKVFIGRYLRMEGTWWVGCTPSETNPAVGLPVFRLRDNTSIPRQLNGTTRINDGWWHYIVGVRNGNKDENYLYVDGKLENTASSPPYSGDFINTADVTFGGYDEPQNYFLDGSLDEIVIFDRVLTGKEIAEYFSSCYHAEIFLPVIIK